MVGRAFLKPSPLVHHRFTSLVRWRLARSLLVWSIFLSSILSLFSKGFAETKPNLVSRKPTRRSSHGAKGRGKTERLLSSARQRSRVDACRLSDGSFLVASEWLKGQNLRRVSLHRCILTPEGARCSGGVDIPMPGHGFGQSHPQLICEGLPKPIVAPKKRNKSRKSRSKKRKSKIAEDMLKITPKISVPAHTPLLYIRQGRLSRGMTQLYLYAVFINPPPRPIYQKQSDHTKNTEYSGKKKRGRRNDHGDKIKRAGDFKRATKLERAAKEVLRKKGGIQPKQVCRLGIPSSIRSKDMIGRITLSPAGEIWLTTHETADGTLPRLWLLKSKNGWTFADSEELFSGQDGKVIPLPDGRRFIVYRKKEKTESRPETYARITDRNNSSWLPPVQISSDQLHLRSSSPFFHPSGKEITLFVAGQNLAVRSHTLYLVTLKIPAIKRQNRSKIKADSPHKNSPIKKEDSKNHNIRVGSIKQMLPLSKKRRLHPEYVSAIPGKKTNSSPDKTLHKSKKAFGETIIIYAQELEKLRFELRALIINNTKR